MKQFIALSCHGSLNDVISCLALISLLILTSCDGNKQPPLPADLVDNTKVPYSVTIAEQNKNMPTGGTITSEYSDSPEGCDVGKIVDDNPETKFVTNYSQYYMLWSGYKNVQIRKYAIISASDSPEGDPKSWTLSASNDGKTWTPLDVQKDVTFFGRQEKKEYEVETAVASKHYKLSVTENNGGSSTQIAEWTLEALSNHIDPLAPYSVTHDNRNNNMPSRGIITSRYSDFPEKSDISKVVDNYPSSKYITYHNEFYIHWKGDEVASVNFYSLTATTDTDRTADPKSWTLSGSNDDETWTVIDTETNVTFASGETKEYHLENETGYTYYKLDIRANNGGTSTQIAEWSMEEIPNSIEDLMHKAGSFSASELTPMGNKFVNRHVTTSADIAWLKDATKEPLSEWLQESGLSKFSVNLYPYGNPIPGDAIQGGLNNCGLPATLASMAYQAPEFIKHIIKDNGNETFTVDMFDPQGNPLKVSVTSRFFSTNGSSLASLKGQKGAATWATVLEKAIWKWNIIYGVWGYALTGIGSEHIVPLFTGDGGSFAFPRGALTKAEITRLVKVCLHQGYFVVGGFNPGGLPIDGFTTIVNHVYTCMHSANKNALFAVRNPHGGTNDGVLNVPNNDVIYPAMDLRVIYRGAATGYGSGNTKPYIPPTK
ncbi:MAG: hypothetical protein LBP56_04555 [Odoribacteraceae bacterium]|jgi:hypothetical protein|nr:hypothetical protein [Odoribacteraceae bacterium]